MSALMIHTEFGNEFDLDPAAVAFLSAMYYRQQQNDRRPISLTQQHIQNLTSVGVYAQRRIRNELVDKALLTEHRAMEFIEGKGYRTKIYYSIDCNRLDSLLASVQASKAAMNGREQLEAIHQTAVADVKPDPMPAVKMNQEWVPDSEVLASYLSAYQIDERFAVYDVLPEFVEYWLNTDCAFRPAQWQAKYHAAIRHQWQGEMNRQRNQVKVLNASDLKANAIVSLKEAQAKNLMSQAGQYRTAQTLEEKLNDRSWAEEDVELLME